MFVQKQQTLQTNQQALSHRCDASVSILTLPHSPQGQRLNSEIQSREEDVCQWGTEGGFISIQGCTEETEHLTPFVLDVFMMFLILISMTFQGRVVLIGSYEEGLFLTLPAQPLFLRTIIFHLLTHPATNQSISVFVLRDCAYKLFILECVWLYSIEERNNLELYCGSTCQAQISIKRREAREGGENTRREKETERWRNNKDKCLFINR